MGFIEDDVKQLNEEKASMEAAAKLPMGFISKDVMKDHEEVAPPPAKVEKKSVMIANNDVGFIAEDVKRQHLEDGVGFIAEDVMKQHAK